MRDRFSNFEQLSKPNIYIIRMVVFLGVVAVLMVPIFGDLIEAFQANIFINAIILGALVVGIVFAFRQVFSLMPEIRWVNTIRMIDPGIEVNAPPVLLAPMAALLRDRQGPMIMSTQTMRSILESVATRLDERRDLSRYMIGLLVFLGLLGTFYGLLNTVSAVGDTISGLSISNANIDLFIGALQEGLAAPLNGMGTAFSSSLFGLAGSLLLGFLDLQASGAQNRFYVEFEDWLSTVTDISADGNIHGEENADIERLLTRLVRMQEIQLQQNSMANQSAAKPTTPTSGAASDKTSEGLMKLAEGLNEVVKVIRQDQKILREELSRQGITHAKILKLLDPSDQGGQ